MKICFIFASQFSINCKAHYLPAFPNPPLYHSIRKNDKMLFTLTALFWYPPIISINIYHDHKNATPLLSFHNGSVMRLPGCIFTFATFVCVHNRVCLSCCEHDDDGGGTPTPYLIFFSSSSRKKYIYAASIHHHNNIQELMYTNIKKSFQRENALSTSEIYIFYSPCVHIYL